MQNIKNLTVLEIENIANILIDYCFDTLTDETLALNAYNNAKDLKKAIIILHNEQPFDIKVNDIEMLHSDFLILSLEDEDLQKCIDYRKKLVETAHSKGHLI